MILEVVGTTIFIDIVFRKISYPYFPKGDLIPIIWRMPLERSHTYLLVLLRAISLRETLYLSLIEYHWGDLIPIP
jgi:hypothetical protein